jgi:hypothetical protein
MTIPPFVSPTVDDGSNTSNQLPVLIGKKILSLTTFKRGILIAAEGGHLIKEEKGHRTIIAAIQIIKELDELSEFTPFSDGTYFYHFVRTQERCFRLWVQI